MQASECARLPAHRNSYPRNSPFFPPLSDRFKAVPSFPRLRMTIVRHDIASSGRDSGRSHAKGSLREKLMSFRLIYYARLVIRVIVKKDTSTMSRRGKEEKKKGGREKLRRRFPSLLLPRFHSRDCSRNIETEIRTSERFKCATCRSSPRSTSRILTKWFFLCKRACGWI